MKIWILKYLVLYGTNVAALRNEAEYVNTHEVLADLLSQECLCSKCFNHQVLKHMVFPEQDFYNVAVYTCDYHHIGVHFLLLLFCSSTRAQL